MSSVDKIWGAIQKVKDKKSPFCAMIVPAAGTSSRMGGQNKLFAELCGVPVLSRTLKAIDQSTLVSEIVVAANPDTMMDVAKLVNDCNLTKKVQVIEGGKTRLESVLAATLAVDSSAEFIAVHDGARPLVLAQEIDELVRVAVRTLAVAPAVPVNDTVKVADDRGLVKSTPNRSELFCVQTPQIFQADILKAALQNAYDKSIEVTDDCSCVEKLGKEVYLTAGNRENIKITTPLDLAIAEAILKSREEELR